MPILINPYQFNSNYIYHITVYPFLTLWRLQFFHKLRRLSTYTRSSLTSSFRSTLSTTQTGTTIFRHASGSCPTFPLHICTHCNSLGLRPLAFNPSCNTSMIHSPSPHCSPAEQQ